MPVNTGWYHNGKAWERHVPGLGYIEVYRDTKGSCVDINGKRAWSSWKQSQDEVKLSLDDTFKKWEYLNLFSKEKEKV